MRLANVTGQVKAGDLTAAIRQQTVTAGPPFIDAKDRFRLLILPGEKLMRAEMAMGFVNRNLA